VCPDSEAHRASEVRVFWGLTLINCAVMILNTAISAIATFMKYLTAAETAKRVQVEKSTVLRWIKKGTFKNVRKVGNKYQIPLSEVNKWWEENVKILHSTKK